METYFNAIAIDQKYFVSLQGDQVELEATELMSSEKDIETFNSKEQEDPEIKQTAPV